MSPVLRSALSRPWPSIVAAIAVPVLAFVTLVAWSLSSAVASSPDDDFHLASIWCGAGIREGLCELPAPYTQEAHPEYRMVPGEIPDATCFAFDSDDSADCWDSDVSGMTMVHRANADGLYPPLFYLAMSPLATEDVMGSVVAMRIVNSAFAVGFLTLVFFALPRRLRPPLLLSLLATSVPLGLFVFASTNPSSWALLSAATVWICLYGSMMTDSVRRRRLLVGLAVAGAVIGAGARADAAIYAVFGVGLALLLGWRRARSSMLPTVGAMVIVAVVALFYVNAGQSGAAINGLTTDAPPLTSGQHMMNFLGVPGLWAGMLGNWGLGWLDTQLPTAVWVLTLLVLGGVLLVGMAGFTWRRTVAVVGALAALWLVPFILLATSHAVIGTQVQPRYVLPLLIIAVGVATASPLVDRLWTGSRVALIGVALSIAAAVALHFNIRRYTTGLDVSAIDPGYAAEWWWPVAPSPMAVWVMGVLGFTGLLAIIWLRAAMPQLFLRKAEHLETDSPSQVNS